MSTTPIEQLNEAQYAYAWTAESYAAAERHAGVRAALALIVSGHRALAHDVLMTSFTRQLRIHGLGYAAQPGRPYEQMGPLPR